MKKQYLEFRVEHQRISRTDGFYVVGGSQKYLHARFQFCEDWEGEEAYAIFSGGGHSYRQKIENGECVVPWEVLCVKQFFVGCEAGDRITSDAAKVDVRPSGAPDADPSREPSPTLQRQVNALREDVDKLKQGSDGGNTGTLPEFGKADAWKLLYVSDDGSIQPLALGAGLKIENGVLILTAAIPDAPDGGEPEPVTIEARLVDGSYILTDSAGETIEAELSDAGFLTWPGVTVYVGNDGLISFEKEE